MEDKKNGFRVVTNPEAAEQDIKVFPAEGAGQDVELLIDAETAKPGALLYGVDDYPALVLLLNNTEGLKGIPTVRFCAGGRGYVKYERRGDGGFPPEDAVRRTMASAPALPRPGVSFTVRQDAKHPEGVVVRDDEAPAEPPVPKTDVDRFITAYMRLGGSFPGLVDAMEEIAKWTSSTR